MLKKEGGNKITIPGACTKFNEINKGAFTEKTFIQILIVLINRKSINKNANELTCKYTNFKSIVQNHICGGFSLFI